jgi:hypothetical protein
MSSTIPGTDTNGGETWTCTVTPNDGDEDGASASTSVVTEEPAVAYGSTEDNPGIACLDILESGDSTGDGTYWIDPDSAGAFEAYCDMTRDSGGWTLVGKVHRADTDSLVELPTWFSDGQNMAPLTSDMEYLNDAPSGWGAARFSGYLDSSDEPISRFDLIQQTDGSRYQSWFKRAPSSSFVHWFNTDGVATEVCDDFLMSSGCSTGVIGSTECVATLGATVLDGMTISGADCPIHIRQEEDTISFLSGLCASSNAVPSSYQGTWGHGLKIWIR